MKDTQPNIIFILTDDLGYGDLGCYGSTLNDTPEIDRMAAEGVRFTDFNAAAWCMPSRLGLMTGCHPHRTGMDLRSKTMIPAMLKEQGYATAMVGKWHLGLEEGLHPLDQGFDSWYGTRGSNDWDGPDVIYDALCHAPEDAWQTPLQIDRKEVGIIPQSEFTQRYTREVKRLIQESKADQPFFIYLAHNMPHVPLFPSPQFQGKSRNGVYGDVIAELDASTGEILQELEQAGIADNTLVVFTSDNGPWTMFKEYGGTARPLRGEKNTTWDGGGRVPCIFHWPGTLPPSVSPTFCVHTDVYATLATLSGGEVAEGQAMDSIDMSEVLQGADSQRSTHIYYNEQAMAYRNGRYKIHFLTRERSRNPDTGEYEASLTCDPPLLFDLEADISESNNIAPQHPEIVTRMTREFEQARSAIENGDPV